MDAATLQAWRDKLVEARMRGIRSMRDQNGEEITFSSDREMQAAIAAADREIAGLSGRRAPHTIYFSRRNCR